MIFYFTGTGNSLYAAKQIGKVLEDEPIAIQQCMKNNQYHFTLMENESIGFVFPCYFFGLPSIVIDFIQKLELANYNKHYIYAVSTCGGNIGNAFSLLRRKLSQRKWHLNAGFELIMPDNYILQFNLLPDKEKMEQLLKNTDPQLDDIYKYILHQKDNKSKSNFKGWLSTTFTYPFYNFVRSTKKYYANENCNGCGNCAKYCPLNMIEMKENKPVWKQGKCTQCIACIHRCPQKAAQYRGKTESRGRYVHPILQSSSK